jgi:hypothetical protein
MSRARAAARRVLGSGHGIAGSVYGTIVVLSIIAGADRGSDTALGHLAVLVGVTAVVLYVAHVYAHGLGESVIRGSRLTRRDVLDLARRESSIILAAALPVAALLLGAVGVVRPTRAIWLAVALGAGALAAQGLRYARLEHLGRPATAAVVGVNLALGLLLIGLKALLAH